MKTAEFVAHFQQTFPNLIGKTVLVALSGGRDSVALLHLLREPVLDLTVEAAHVHHGLRGVEADEDAEFCGRLCQDLGAPFAVLHLPLDDLRPATGEAAWRRRRYRALLDHAGRRRLDTIATGHHQDDVAEGVLVQLLRGAGPRAMSGITAETADGVIRPLLPWDREAIESWLTARGLKWREDSSNLDLDRMRNRVRHVVLPELEKITPRLRRHLVNLAHATAAGEEYLAAELARRAPFADPWDPDGGVELAILRGLEPALRTRWLHGQMLRLGVERTTRRQLDLFNQLLDSGRPRSVTMGSRWRLRRARESIWAEPPNPLGSLEATLEADQSIDLWVPGWKARFRVDEDPDGRARWWWRPPSATGSITVRGVRDDDLLPDGVGGHRRARKVAAEILPRHLRAAWPVFCENDMIQWIPGVWEHPTPRDPSNWVVEVIRQ